MAPSRASPTANVFAVQSPLQLLCAIEARRHFPASEDILIALYVMPSDSGNSRQLRDALALARWSLVIEVPHAGAWDPLVRYRMIARVRERHTVENVFIGDIGSDVMREALLAFPGSAGYLLDDGLVTVLVQKAFLEAGKAEISRDCAPYDYETGTTVPSARSKARMLFRAVCRRIFLGRTPAPATVNLFTAFDCAPCPGQKVIRHSFRQLRERKSGQRIASDLVYFYGRAYDATAGPSVQQELGLIRAIAEHYERLGLRFKYVPHRSEPQDKLRRLREELGIAVEGGALPAELEIITAAEVPAHIGACSSTVLATLPLLHDFSGVTVFRLPQDIEMEDAPVRDYLEARVHTLEVRRVQGAPAPDGLPVFVVGEAGVREKADA